MKTRDATFPIILGGILLLTVFVLYGKDLLTLSWIKVEAHIISYEETKYPVNTKYYGTVERNYNIVSLDFRIENKELKQQM